MTAETSHTTSTTSESHEFQAEVSRLLHLMVHSVYSNKDIFLRELISNAADACEKLRWRALTEPALIAEGAKLAITITAGEDKLTIADNGVGMDRGELIANLGTIAKSGTRAFLDQIADRQENSRLIGQFGVGFYSAFMVADEVTVVSRSAGTNEAWTWRSDGMGSFEIERAELADAPEHGTRVVLTLKDDAKTYADGPTIERIVKEYSAHVPVPIELVAAESEGKELTDGSALWAKPKSEISKDEYKDFYGTVAGQWDEPALTIHYHAEGRHEYSVLLFVPSMKPFDLFDPARKGKVKLYVRRVFISDEVELLPAWARFVRGVIDSEDLPLNLSREMLQHNPVLDAIRKAVTTRILSDLGKLAESDAETYAKVWDAFGAVIKEGLYEEAERRDDLFKVARFKTTKSGDGWRSLADYVKDLKQNQTRIFYVLADSTDRALASPHLEGFKARDVEVLLLSDPVDAFWVRTALGFDGKPFQSVTQGATDLDQIPETETIDKPADGQAAASLIAYLKQQLKDRVGDVRTSNRLAESPVCLVAPDYGPDKQFEKIMARHEGLGQMSKPILEINPGHAQIAAMTRRLETGDTAALEDAAVILLGQAKILDGEAPDDPADFARRLGRVLAAQLG
ncbi:MAG: molecular chaperone HtpG [Ancalomicrobiaceae bacterium]|nr:molecular chaperone HtpG [Ancalomicrobiaceae bacterium]